jgi:hypothetical protein
MCACGMWLSLYPCFSSWTRLRVPTRLSFLARQLVRQTIRSSLLGARPPGEGSGCAVGGWPNPSESRNSGPPGTARLGYRVGLGKIVLTSLFDGLTRPAVNALPKKTVAARHRLMWPTWFSSVKISGLSLSVLNFATSIVGATADSLEGIRAYTPCNEL